MPKVFLQISNSKISSHEVENLIVGKPNFWMALTSNDDIRSAILISVSRSYSYLSVCTRMFRMLPVCYSYVTRMLLVVVWCFNHDPITSIRSQLQTLTIVSNELFMAVRNDMKIRR